MTQYTLQIDNSKQADALMLYLKTLPFVEIKPVTTTKKEKAIKDSIVFLNSLPQQSAQQSDINKAVKSIREKHGYK